MWTSPKHFIVQTSPEGLFRFEGPAFETVQELIIHQVYFSFLKYQYIDKKSPNFKALANNNIIY